MVEERPYSTVEDRHLAGLAGGNSANSRETVIMVREPEPDIKAGDIVMHQAGRKKVPVMVREVLSVDQMHKSKLFKIFYRYLTKEESGKAMEKTCPHCGKTFITTDGRQKYCSVRCRVAAADEKRLKKEAEEKEANDEVSEKTAEIPETPENPITPEPLAPEPSVIGKSYGDYSKEFPDYFRPDNKNIRAAKKILELVPQDSDYTLKISLESADIQLAVTLCRNGKGNAD
jgi:endogenous inhibitor of DNA gyrase (YacG/DUF329 family)